MSSSSSSDVSALVATEFSKDSPSFISRMPSEILVEFISRLPLRSLIISTSVCKSWYALLKNPYFATKHIQHTPAHTYFLFRRRQVGRPDFRTVSLVSSTESFDISINIFNNIPFLQKSKLRLRISGSCNGLVCLSVEPYHKASIIILWNPITRVFKALPVSPVKRPNFSPRDVILGFGFDPIANDFKLLRIVYYGYDGNNQVDIYSLSTNSWRKIQSHKGSLVYRASRVLVNGRFHWKACEILSERDLIATFDISKEVFTHIQLPNLFGIHPEELDGDELGWELVVWKDDFLGMTIYPKYGIGEYFDMWLLDEYGVEKSWTKHFTFVCHTDIHKPLACKSNGEILLYKNNGQLVVYDYVTRTFNYGDYATLLCGEVFNYVGSLLPIEGGSTMEEVNLAAVEPDPFFVRYILEGKDAGLSTDLDEITSIPSLEL